MTLTRLCFALPGSGGPNEKPAQGPRRCDQARHYDRIRGGPELHRARLHAGGRGDGGKQSGGGVRLSVSERCLLCVSSVQYASCFVLIPSPPAAAHQRRKLLLSGYIMSSNIHKRYADRAFVAAPPAKGRARPPSTHSSRRAQSPLTSRRSSRRWGSCT